MKNLLFLLGNERKIYTFVILCAAIVTGSEALLHPLLMKAIFDAVSMRQSFSQFVYLGMAYLTLGLVINFLNYFMSLWKLKIDNRIVGRVSEDLLRAYFNKDFREVIREGSGYYIARIRSDVKDGLAPMLVAVRDMAVNIVTFLLLISVLIYLSLQAFLILAIIIPVSSYVSILVSRKIRKLTNVERDTEATLVDTLSRAVSAFKMVRVFGLQPKTLQTFTGTMNYALDSNYQKLRVVRLLQGAGDLTMVVSDVCSIFVGAYFVFRDRMTLGSFIAFMNAFWRAATTLIAIFNKWAEIHGYSATIDRLIAFIDESPTKPRLGNARCVSAQAIDYAYDDTPVLTGFSIQVRPGERSLIVGENGAGKTTLANILSGYLDPTTGQLDLPARISSVTLPVHFPPMTVRDLPIDAKLLSLFGVHNEAILNSKPDLLSAGQQQKVALALALTSDADLYVLDEPLANLDTASRITAMQAIRERTHGRMLVMIMHDPKEFVPLFDHIHHLSRNHASAA
jgi:ATP-binding cassette subfamily B protein